MRGGYSYEPTPVPEQIGESNLADSDKHTFSAGRGLELPRLQPILPRPLSLDAHFALTFCPSAPTASSTRSIASATSWPAAWCVQVGLC